MDRKLSSYAFNNYGHDAYLYNAIHDMETQIAALQERAGESVYPSAPELDEMMSSRRRIPQA